MSVNPSLQHSKSVQSVQQTQIGEVEKLAAVNSSKSKKSGLHLVNYNKKSSKKSSSDDDDENLEDMEDEQAYDGLHQDINLDDEYNNAKNHMKNIEDELEYADVNIEDQAFYGQMDDLIDEQDVDIIDEYNPTKFAIKNSRNRGAIKRQPKGSPSDGKILKPVDEPIEDRSIEQQNSPSEMPLAIEDESGRRLSYKEDDLIRKQRLKENLNQLLIEYKHEEEAHLKKYSKFASNSNLNPKPVANNSNTSNRSSLDSSCYKLNQTKNSAFSLVQQNATSAFRPISLPGSGSKALTAGAKNAGSTESKGLSSSSSSWSSNSSSSSSSNSASSSNSPPKTRAIASNSNTITNTTPIDLANANNSLDQMVRLFFF
jgi:hypothetical protein